MRCYGHLSMRKLNQKNRRGGCRCPLVLTRRAHEDGARRTCAVAGTPTPSPGNEEESIRREEKREFGPPVVLAECARSEGAHSMRAVRATRCSSSEREKQCR